MNGLDVTFLSPAQAVAGLAAVVLALAAAEVVAAYREDDLRSVPLDGDAVLRLARLRRDGNAADGLYLSAWRLPAPPALPPEPRWWDADAPAWALTHPALPAVAPGAEVPAAVLPQRPPYQRRAA